MDRNESILKVIVTTKPTTYLNSEFELDRNDNITNYNNGNTISVDMIVYTKRFRYDITLMSLPTKSICIIYKSTVFSKILKTNHDIYTWVTLLRPNIGKIQSTF